MTDEPISVVLRILGGPGTRIGMRVWRALCPVCEAEYDAIAWPGHRRRALRPMEVVTPRGPRMAEWIAVCSESCAAA